MQTEKRKKEHVKYKDNYKKQVYWDLLNTCSENINDLAKCAEILLNNHMYSKSFFMSYLALEELGKRRVICDYIDDILSDDEFESAFKNHKFKIAYLHNTCKLSRISKSNTFEGAIVYDVNEFNGLFKKRQQSVYVDFDFKNEKISNPITEITSSDAEKIYTNLRKAIEDTNCFEDVTERIGSKAFYK